MINAETTMKKSRYTGSQIIAVLKEVDVERKIEEGNAKLKNMFADVSLKNNVIKKIVAKKGW